MSLDEFITLATRQVPLPKDAEQAAQRLAISKAALCDLVAGTVAEGLLNGARSWSAGDAAMNNLFSYALEDPALKDLPPFARRVFDAFDEGEYQHVGEPAAFQGEARTAVLLEAVMSGSTEVPALFGEHASMRRSQATAAAIARRALNGEVSPILAARELVDLRCRLGVADDDSDFLACVAIDSETDALPLGPVRQFWAPSALAEKDQEIAQAEEWAMRAGETAFRNIALRFPHE